MASKFEGLGDYLDQQNQAAESARAEAAEAAEAAEREEDCAFWRIPRSGTA